MLTRGLLFKGLAAGTALGGLGVAIHQRKNIATLLSPSSGKKKVWGELECGEANGSECSIKQGGKILIKKGESSSSFEVTSLGEGKMKVYKVEGSEQYSDNLKFLIEDNDISGSSNNKLEEFESYEIKLGADSETDVNLRGKHYLLRKTDAKTEIKNALGLSCDLNGSTQDCNITNNKVGSVAISGGTVTLTISTETSKDEYPLGYKFTFKNTVDANATLIFGGETITLKKDSPVDFKIKKEGSSLSLEKAWTLEELTKKVGLVKDGEGYWFVGSSGMNVKVDSTKKTSMPKYGNPDGRIKVYSDQAGYREGLKFTIEKGDLDLTDNNGGNTSSYTLGQFQSFEIVKDSDGTWYFSRKEGDESKIKELLGLKCELPTSQSSQECTLSTENIKTIKFDGKAEGDVTVSGSPKLTISKESGRLDYPLGYKFNFSSQSDSTITIPSGSPITLKSNLSYEYKIKRAEDNKNNLSLERAWTPKVLMEKAVKFAESSKDNEWSVEGDGISIKQDSNKTSDAKASNSSSKIRVYEGVPGYNQGMKFVIEESDGALTGGGNSINKLSKYETYEISQDSTDNNNWYFTRKKKSDESIRELLGLPEDCSMPTDQSANQSCELNVSALGGVKFDGKGTGSATITESGNNITLKISKENDTTAFPLGYKFTFSSEQTGFTVPKNGSGNIEVKKGTNTEFKIKESGSTLTLEKAWTAESLGEKVKLSCSNNSCTFGDNINVYESDSSYVNEATITDSSGKTLTYEENADGHNQGIKFSFTGDNDINLNTTSATGGSSTKPSTISKKNGNTPTYEIAQKTPSGGTAKWYLVKKSN